MRSDPGASCCTETPLARSSFSSIVSGSGSSGGEPDSCSSVAASDGRRRLVLSQAGFKRQQQFVKHQDRRQDGETNTCRPATSSNNGHTIERPASSVLNWPLISVLGFGGAKCKHQDHQLADCQTRAVSLKWDRVYSALVAVFLCLVEVFQLKAWTRLFAILGETRAESKVAVRRQASCAPRLQRAPSSESSAAHASCEESLSSDASEQVASNAAVAMKHSTRLRSTTAGSQSSSTHRVNQQASRRRNNAGAPAAPAAASLVEPAPTSGAKPAGANRLVRPTSARPHSRLKVRSKTVASQDSDADSLWLSSQAASSDAPQAFYQATAVGISSPAEHLLLLQQQQRQQNLVIHQQHQPESHCWACASGAARRTMRPINELSQWRSMEVTQRRLAGPAPGFWSPELGGPQQQFQFQHHYDHQQHRQHQHQQPQHQHQHQHHHQHQHGQTQMLSYQHQHNHWHGQFADTRLAIDPTLAANYCDLLVRPRSQACGSRLGGQLRAATLANDDDDAFRSLEKVRRGAKSEPAKRTSVEAEPGGASSAPGNSRAGPATAAAASAATSAKSIEVEANAHRLASKLGKLSLAGAKRRFGFKRQGLTQISVHRSEEVWPSGLQLSGSSSANNSTSVPDSGTESGPIR